MLKFLLAAFVILLPLLFIYKRVYFRPLAFVRFNFDSHNFDIVSLKPKQFKSFFGGSYVSVRCSDSLIFIHPCSDTFVTKFDSVALPDGFLIAKIKRGRFVPITLSDREFIKISSKIM